MGVWTGSSWLRIENLLEVGCGGIDWIELAQDRSSGSGMWGYGLDRAGSG